MAVSLSFTKTFSAGGVSVSGAMSRNCTSQIGHNVTLPAGQPGILTTRTDNDTGIITLDSSAVPTVTTSDRVTVYWTGGVRYACTVTAVGATTVSVDLGAGDNLPVLNTAVVLSKEVVVDTDFSGTNVLGFGASFSTGEGHVRFDERFGTDTTPIAAQRVPAGEMYGWVSNSGFTNPITGFTVGAIVMSTGGTVSATGYMAVGY